MNDSRLVYVILCWNVRGLGDQQKCDDVRSTISSSPPHIVCLQETKLQAPSPHQHRSFLHPSLDAITYLPAAGTRGGLATAWNSNSFSLTSSLPKTFTLTTSFAATASNYSFSLTNVYAPSDHRDTPSFLEELHDVAATVSGPWILAGDFNLIREAHEKNNLLFNSHLASSFNDTIHDLALLELPLLDRLFTWSNKRQSPTLARLDRVLFNLDFGDAFPNCSLTSRTRNTSDHVPLVISLSTDIPRPFLFRFENLWLLNPSFLHTVLPVWSAVAPRSDAAGNLVARVKALRSAAKVWSKTQRKPPCFLNNCRFLIHLLDVFEETRTLSTGELRLRLLCQDRLALAVRQQAAYWKQRGKCRAVKEDDENTRYFHARASQRLRRNNIRLVQVDGVDHIAHSAKTAVLTDYYARLLGRADDVAWSFDLETLYRGAASADQAALVSPFTAAEALSAVSAMNASSAPGPDGVGPGFYNKSWATTGPAVLAFLDAFHRGEVSLQCINRVLIVLIPKKPGAVSPDTFRRISLQNCPVKILTKIMTSRLQKQIPKLIDIDQTGFIQGRSISENFVYATELVQCCHKRRRPTMVLKLDFAKAFDSVNWDSLLSILRCRGFPQLWIDWLHMILHSSRSAIVVNGCPGPWITCRRGLRQGDALSPYLFLLVADVLQRLIKEDGAVRHPLIDAPCPVLQYADDTLILVRTESDDVIRLRSLLDAFSTATGLKINYSKSTAVPMHVPEARLRRLLRVLQCSRASFP
ncbi:unnamed protein product [Urochloa humidicola]